ncbi:MAG TPA: T9SS type A sorting domain-containing protein, partial [Saprospiraceae bacterium]|nr:T9SS type A sorting domain-containing protein [Saprospiraceae bacterium]
DQISPSACTNDGNGLFSIIRIGLNIFGCISIFDNTTITAVADLTDFRYNITPNPARDYIHISNKNINNEIIDVQIMNINGGVVKSAKYSSEEKDLSLSGLNPGNYIVKINDGFNTEVKKIVKQ